jgi:hypothetical protein
LQQQASLPQVLPLKQADIQSKLRDNYPRMSARTLVAAIQSKLPEHSAHTSAGGGYTIQTPGQLPTYANPSAGWRIHSPNSGTTAYIRQPERWWWLYSPNSRSTPLIREPECWGRIYNSDTGTTANLCEPVLGLQRRFSLWHASRQRFKSKGAFFISARPLTETPERLKTYRTKSTLCVELARRVPKANMRKLTHIRWSHALSASRSGPCRLCTLSTV